MPPSVLGPTWKWVEATQSYLHDSGDAVVWKDLQGNWKGHGATAHGELVAMAAVIKLKEQESTFREPQRKVASY